MQPAGVNLMLNTPFLWTIILPIASAPWIYLAGRLQQHSRWNNRASFSAWLAVLVMLATWVPFSMAASQFTAQGTQQILIDNIPLRFDGLSLLLSVVALGLGTLVTLFSGPMMQHKPGEEKYFAMLTTVV